MSHPSEVGPSPVTAMSRPGCGRWSWLRLGAVAIGLAAWAAFLGAVFSFHACKVLAKQDLLAYIKPVRISLDATEGRDRPLLGVDATILTPKVLSRNIALRDGICDLKMDNGASLLQMHLVDSKYTGSSMARFAIELEHGSMQEAIAVMQRVGGAAAMNCNLGVGVDIFNSGWTFPLRHRVSMPMDLGQGKEFKTRLVRENMRPMTQATATSPLTFDEFTLPTLQDPTAAATVGYRVELSMPSHVATGFLRIMEGVPVEVKASVTLTEEDVGALEARITVDTALRRWAESSSAEERTVFALPVKVAGRANTAALGAVLSAATAGECAEFRREGGQHFHVRPCGPGQKPYPKVALVARSPGCAMARAFGARHSISVRPDDRPGAPTLSESLVQGRRLVARKLSGGTLEGYGARLHARIFLDDWLGVRVDLDVKGGDLADPALKVSAGVLLSVTEDHEWMTNDWEYNSHALALMARIRLDLDAPSGSAEISQKLVMDMTAERPEGSVHKYRNGTVFEGPVWEHEVREVSMDAFISYDHSQKLIRAGGKLHVMNIHDMLVGLRGVSNYTWLSSNPTRDTPYYDPFYLLGRGRRLLDAVPETTLADALVVRGRRLVDVVAGSAAGSQIETVARRLSSGARRFTDPDTESSVGNKIESVARRLASRFEHAENSSDTVVFNVSAGFGGSGRDKLTVDAFAAATGVGHLNFTLKSTETRPSVLSNAVNLDVQVMDGGGSFTLGEQIAPTLTGGSDLKLSFDPDEEAHLDMSMSGSAELIMDMSVSNTAQLRGAVSLLPACSVQSGDEDVLRSLSAMNIFVEVSNPQCSKCTVGGSWHSSWEPAGGYVLHSSCGWQNDTWWRSTRWESSSSCCDIYGNLPIRMAPGSEMTETHDFSFFRPDDWKDFFGWLNQTMSISDLTDGMYSRLETRYMTVGMETHRTWRLVANSSNDPDLVLNLKEVANRIGGTSYDLDVMEGQKKLADVSIATEDRDNTLGAVLRVIPADDPNGTFEVKAFFDQGSGDDDSYTLGAHLKEGQSLGQVLAVAVMISTAGDETLANGTIHEDEHTKVGFAQLTLIDGPTVPRGLDVVVKDGDDRNVSHVSLNVAETTDRNTGFTTFTGAGFIEDSSTRLGSVELTFAEGPTFPETVMVLIKDGNNTQVGHLSLTVAETANNTGSTKYVGAGFIESNSSKVGSAMVTFIDRGTGSFDVDASVEDDQDEQVFRVEADVDGSGNRYALKGSIEEGKKKVGSVAAMAELADNETRYVASLKVKDDSDAVVAALSADFSRPTGGVSADLTVKGTSEGSLAGTIPPQGNFYAGDVTFTVGSDTQAIWVNVSDDFVPAAPKDGLSGFKRWHFTLGTTIDKEVINVSTYLEEPPFGGGLSGCGIAARVNEVEQGLMPDSVDVSVDLDLPFEMSSGSSVVVQEVVQQVSTDVVMADVTTFVATVYKDEMAKAAGIDPALVEVESVGYKVEAGYSFPAVVTQREATTAIATANNVTNDRVQVTITSKSRRLQMRKQGRRLQGVDVQATITAASAAAVSTLQTTAQDASALSAALQTTSNKILTASVTAAPVAKVSVVTTMRTAATPTLDTARLQNLGTAVGGTVQVTQVKPVTQTTVRQAPSTTPTQAPAGGTTLPPSATPTSSRAPSPTPTPTQAGGTTLPPSPTPSPTPEGQMVVDFSTRTAKPVTAIVWSCAAASAIVFAA
uniref:Uncharacterized protein n=1 Tax=Alexandrium monilatum TaxID=311494 RepID=A0A7S4SXC9_9DINO